MKKIWSWIEAHSYSYATLYLIFYLVIFFSLETLQSPRYLIHCRLDDYIPFCEWFAVFYYIWFLVFPASLFFSLFFSKEDFQNLCLIMMNGTTFCFLCYIIWPTELNLRVDIERTNLLCRMMKLIWSLDTPTNVCPSLHVSVSTAIALVAFKSEKIMKHVLLKWTIILLMIMICVSTIFVKQHSVIDVFCGIMVTAVFGWITYKTDWKSLIRKTPFKFML